MIVYLVSQFTQTRNEPSMQDERVFDDRNEAIRFYDDINLEDMFHTEVSCSNVKACENKAFCKEILVASYVDGEIVSFEDSIDYDEYDINDYKKDYWN